MTQEIRFVPPFIKKKGFTMRMGELRDVVGCQVERSLWAIWKLFLVRGPIERLAIDPADRLNAVAVAVGEMETEDAVRAACIRFRRGLPLKATPEIKEIVWNILVFGSDPERWAAALAIEAFANDDEHAARDKYLRQIHDQIQVESERDIPPEIWSCLESIAMYKYTSNVPASGNEKQTPEKPHPAAKQK